MPPGFVTHEKFREEEVPLGVLASWIKVSEAASRAKRSPQWLTTLAYRGEVRAAYTPYGYLFDPEDLNRLIQERNYNDFFRGTGTPSKRGKRALNRLR